MVAEAAYYRAMQRGFIAGGEVEDWLAAEREIDRQLAGTRNPLSVRSAPTQGKNREEVDMKVVRSQ
jgi:hypothetical protein